MNEKLKEWKDKLNKRTIDENWEFLNLKEFYLLHKDKICIAHFYCDDTFVISGGINYQCNCFLEKGKETKIAFIKEKNIFVSEENYEGNIETRPYIKIFFDDDNEVFNISVDGIPHEYIDIFDGDEKYEKAVIFFKEDFENYNSDFMMSDIRKSEISNNISFGNLLIPDYIYNRCISNLKDNDEYIDKIKNLLIKEVKKDLRDNFLNVIRKNIGKTYIDEKNVNIILKASFLKEDKDKIDKNLINKAVNIAKEQINNFKTKDTIEYFNKNIQNILNRNLYNMNISIYTEQIKK